MTIHYDFKTAPYAHQLTTLEACWDKSEWGLFLDMGTGKTFIALNNAAMLYDAGKIEGLLVIAPKGVYRNWTEKEIPKHLPDHIPARIATWRSPLDKKTRADINNLFTPNDDLNILVMNIDTLITKDGAMVIEKFLRSRACMMVIDESSLVKNGKAKRTKAAINFGKLAIFRRILTGSPVTKSPLDVYTQCEFLSPHLLGFSSFYGFRNRYATTARQAFGGRSFVQVTGYQNIDELQRILKEFTTRLTKDECLDLPPKIFMRREFDMTPEQKKVYTMMRENALALLREEEADGGAVSATSAITQLLRLHQISCGFFPTDEGMILPLKHNRMNELMELLQETSGKVIIWANYRHDIFEINRKLYKEFGEDSVVTYFGDTSDDDRVEAVRAFQDGASPVRFFLGNTQTGGYGITLTAAGTVVYYSNNYDLEKRLQSEDRAHRIGQDKTVTYVDLVCRETVDDKIITALRNKSSMAQAITGDKWREWI